MTAPPNRKQIGQWHEEWSDGEFDGSAMERERCIKAVSAGTIGYQDSASDFDDGVRTGIAYAVARIRAEPAAHLATTEQPQPEPARPLTLDERVKKAVQNDAPLDMYVANLAQLCRDFAREALLCLVLDQVSNTPHKYREEIEYAISAAEKGEVPR